MTKRIYPCDLSDGEYKYLKKCFPKQRNFGRPPAPHAARDFERHLLFAQNRLRAAVFTTRIILVGKRFIIIFGCGAKRVGGRKPTKDCAERLRARSGRKGQSSVGIIDSQSSQTVDTAGKAVSFDGGKKIKGRKRHLLVDSLGLLITVVVHAAGISETAGAREVLAELIGDGRRWRLIGLDGGSQESLIEWIKGLKRWVE